MQDAKQHLVVLMQDAKQLRCCFDKYICAVKIYKQNNIYKLISFMTFKLNWGGGHISGSISCYNVGYIAFDEKFAVLLVCHIA